MNEEHTTGNEVLLDPLGFVEVRLIGPQSYQSIEAVAKRCRPFIDKLNYARKPLLGLIDFTEHKHFDTGSTKAALKMLEEIPYKRAAMYGTNPILLEISRGIVAALGKGASTKVFGSREEAVAWLLMKDPLEG